MASDTRSKPLLACTKDLLNNGGAGRRQLLGNTMPRESIRGMYQGSRDLPWEQHSSALDAIASSDARALVAALLRYPPTKLHSA